MDRGNAKCPSRRRPLGAVALVSAGYGRLADRRTRSGRTEHDYFSQGCGENASVKEHLRRGRSFYLSQFQVNYRRSRQMPVCYSGVGYRAADSVGVSLLTA